MPRPILSVFLMALLALSSPSACGEETSPKPAAGPSKTPSEAIHHLFQSLDEANRAAVIKSWDAGTPNETKLVEARADMMLAVAKLKQAVRTKMGAAAQFELQMATVSEKEDPKIEEKQDGDRATATVSPPAATPGSPSEEYSLIKKNGDWKLVLAEAEKQPVDDATEKAAKRLIQIVNSAANAVAAEELKSPQQVLQRISESMAAP